MDGYSISATPGTVVIRGNEAGLLQLITEIRAAILNGSHSRVDNSGSGAVVTFVRTENWLLEKSP